LTSALTGDSLREAVIDLFLKDVESPLVTSRLDGETKTDQERTELRKVYITGKISDLSIDLLKSKDEKRPIKVEKKE